MYLIIKFTKYRASKDVRALINQTQIKTKETRLNVIVCLYLSPDPNQFSEVNMAGGLGYPYWVLVDISSFTCPAFFHLLCDERNLPSLSLFVKTEKQQFLSS